MQKNTSWTNFKLAWSDLKNNKMFIFLVFTIFIILGIIDTTLGYNEDIVTEVAHGSLTVSIIINLLYIYLIGGLMLEVLKIIDGKKASIKKVFTWPFSWTHGLKFFLSYILYSILLLLPLVIIFILSMLSIINFESTDAFWALMVGLIFSLFLSFYLSFAFWLAAENRNTVLANISKSISMVSKNFKKVILWYLIISGIFLALILIISALGILLAMFFLSGAPSIVPGLLLIFPILILIFIPVFIILSAWTSISFAHLYREIDPDVEKDFRNIEIEFDSEK